MTLEVVADQQKAIWKKTKSAGWVTGDGERVRDLALAGA
jgi:hypothetical protein